MWPFLAFRRETWDEFFRLADEGKFLPILELGVLRELARVWLLEESCRKLAFFLCLCLCLYLSRSFW